MDILRTMVFRGWHLSACPAAHPSRLSVLTETEENKEMISAQNSKSTNRTLHKKRKSGKVGNSVKVDMKW
jgi:hypothetical protein